MPIAPEIANAASTYRWNGDLLNKAVNGLSPAEWLSRPNNSTNNMLWIAGHIIWARGNASGLLGSPWSRPWCPLFARGAKLVEPDQYPTAEEITGAWQEVSSSLTAAMESASDQALAAPAPERIPSFDGKVSGVLGFLAFHESYHVGQAAYLRCWLGHGGVIG